MLFQRAKIQVICKQFTTTCKQLKLPRCCFKEQRYKLYASNSQRIFVLHPTSPSCFKEQRYKLYASNSQRFIEPSYNNVGCFKEQRYKLYASNSQQYLGNNSIGYRCFKEQRYKLYASNSQPVRKDFLDNYVVSKSKDTSYMQAIHNSI